MLWTEVPNLVCICIEPIMFYPYAVAQENLAKGFMFLKDKPATFGGLETFVVKVYS